MVSGIGPADTLKQHNITVLADRPGVGQNMMDDVLLAGPSWEIDLETSAIMSNPASAGELVQEYLVNHTGPLTNGVADYIAYGKVPTTNLSATTRKALSSFPSDWPDAEWILASAFFGPGFGPPDNKNYGSVVIGLLSTLSRGSVSISSSNMADAPIIDPAWLTDPVDQEVAVAAFKYARSFFQTEALQPILIGGEVWPGANITTDVEILQNIQATFLNIYHAAGTCAMGKVNDPMAVVDSAARVIGVQALRVVDISAFPFLPPGQPQGTVYMLAEKIADAILAGL